MTKFTLYKPDTSELQDFQKDYYQNNPKETIWVNDKYIVHKREDVPLENNENVLMTHLSIRNNENSAIRDWRDMQYIKNELVGEENEGVEIFPRESRLVDTANQFHLWVFQDISNGIPVGFNERLVTDIHEHPQHKHKLNIGGKQRPFEADRKPSDNYKNFKLMIDTFKKTFKVK